MQHLPSDENVKPAGDVANWNMDKLNSEHRKEANRWRDGYYWGDAEFKRWWADVVAPHGR